MTDDLKKTEGGLLKISAFSTHRSNEPLALEVAWEQLPGKSAQLGDKFEAPCWSPANYASGSTRADENVTSLSCLVFDLDAEITEELAKNLEPYTYIAHTTFTPGRWRIIVRTSRPHTAREHKKLWTHFNALCGNVFDEQCPDPSRLYFCPTHRAGVVPECERNQGRSVDVDAVVGVQPAPVETPQVVVMDTVVDLEPWRKKADSIRDDDLRELMQQVLSLDWAPPPGHRETKMHRAMSVLGSWNVGEVTANAIITSVVQRMDTEDKGEEHYQRAFESSYLRSQELHRAEVADTKALQRLVEAKAVEAGEVPEWRGTMQRVENDDGGFKYKPTGANVEIILRNHSEFKGIRFNVVTRKAECKDGALAGADFNNIDTRLSNWLSRSEFKMNVSRDECLAQIRSVIADRHYDPLKEYLSGLKWDGTARITDVLRKRCGVVEGGDFYVNKVSRMFFISAARRGLEPGTQVDTMLILKGPGGAGKTTFVRALGGEFAAETTLDIHNKDGLMGITGKWLVEQAEMAAMRKSEEESFRAFVTRVSDEFRPPYGRTLESFPRRCVFIGTSNVEMLNDVEGVRRYWPVTVGKIDIEWIKENRDQLWAEAVAAAKSNEVHYFSDAERLIVEPEVNMHQRSDLLGELVQDWFMRMQKNTRPKEITVKQALMGAVELNGKDLMDPKHAIQMGKALHLLGFAKKRRNSGRREWYYETPAYILEGVPQSRMLQVVTPPMAREGQ